MADVRSEEQKKEPKLWSPLLSRRGSWASAASQSSASFCSAVEDVISSRPGKQSVPSAAEPVWPTGPEPLPAAPCWGYRPEWKSWGPSLAWPCVFRDEAAPSFNPHRLLALPLGAVAQEFPRFRKNILDAPPKVRAQFRAAWAANDAARLVPVLWACWRQGNFEPPVRKQGCPPHRHKTVRFASPRAAGSPRTSSWRAEARARKSALSPSARSA
eukprot:TRINITY_DN10495_c0_g1_i1.p1 TRINITY_DN10495_c0_g1~~TRINITY_DN10495_c0_g1_i1.p1  ORF type:complete len:230 (+),score=31.83 TRINITY_DN10495_c0_g1_i1:51-692(+)